MGAHPQYPIPENASMIRPRAMRKIHDCDRCLLYAHEPYLVCAVHPTGIEGNSCLDFRPDPDAQNQQFEDFLGLQQQTEEEMEFELPVEELWQPEGASYYNGELVLQPQQRWTPEEQMELLDTHPMFTGRCPQCECPFPRSGRPPVHWDCPCGWVDDSV